MMQQTTAIMMIAIVANSSLFLFESLGMLDLFLEHLPDFTGKIICLAQGEQRICETQHFHACDIPHSTLDIDVELHIRLRDSEGDANGIFRSC